VADLFVGIPEAVPKEEQHRKQPGGYQREDERVFDECLPFVPLPGCGAPCGHGDSNAGGRAAGGAGAAYGGNAKKLFAFGRPG
jgi:hypothetical protein